MVKPIETVYKGYRFRSRLEARWAVFFDALDIEWYYEPEGFQLSDGTMYLPDFYLPQCKTFFEVKGIMKEEDQHKIDLLSADLKMPVAVGYADMTFQSPDNWYNSYQLSPKSESLLVVCDKCDKPYFVGNLGCYECLCCGYYDGDNTFGILGWGDHSQEYRYNNNSAFKYAIEKARQARFEHGETPA